MELQSTSAPQLLSADSIPYGGRKGDVSRRGDGDRGKDDLLAGGVQSKGRVSSFSLEQSRSSITRLLVCLAFTVFFVRSVFVFEALPLFETNMRYDRDHQGAMLAARYWGEAVSLIAAAVVWQRLRHPNASFYFVTCGLLWELYFIVLFFFSQTNYYELWINRIASGLSFGFVVLSVFDILLKWNGQSRIASSLSFVLMSFPISMLCAKYVVDSCQTSLESHVTAMLGAGVLVVLVFGVCCRKLHVSPQRHPSLAGNNDARDFKASNVAFWKGLDAPGTASSQLTTTTGCGMLLLSGFAAGYCIGGVMGMYPIAMLDQFTTHVRLYEMPMMSLLPLMLMALAVFACSLLHRMCNETDASTRKRWARYIPCALFLACGAFLFSMGNILSLVRAVVRVSAALVLGVPAGFMVVLSFLSSPQPQGLISCLYWTAGACMGAGVSVLLSGGILEVAGNWGVVYRYWGLAAAAAGGLVLLLPKEV